MDIVVLAIKRNTHQKIIYRMDYNSDIDCGNDDILACLYCSGFFSK